ncbi:MAG TPA: hypothetical protein VEB18_03160 [Candidatus Paceibacterota bacterium]|nr:hypothetical protein [Candidatus Paceibacterota bacterium]
MNDLASLGLLMRSGTSGESSEQRLELRIASTDAFVAWFQRVTRMSAAEEVVSTNTQIVRRSELSDEQFSAAQSWLREQLLATY